MIRALQKKFVITSMTAVSILLLVLLGGINLTNMVISGKETNRTLGWITLQELGEFPDNPGANAHDPFSGKESIAPDSVSSNNKSEADGSPSENESTENIALENDSQADKPPEPPSSPFDPGRNAEDAILSSNYFVVRTDLSGEVLSTDVTRVSTLSEEDADALAASVWQAAEANGVNGKYKYSVRVDTEKEEVVLIFLDTSQEIFSSLRVLLLSIALGVLCWILMLLLVILLSKRAIRPFAENIQKQKQFVTNAGHEIKTPLAIILANTDAMELYNGENKWSRNIREQVNRLNGLMKNLLTLARMDEATLQITPSDFYFSALVQENADAFAEPFALRQIAMQTEIQPDLQLHADQGHITQLLSILLENALKYTNDGGSVTITLKKESRGTLLQVANTCDTLPDVPPARLFDRFYRADAARTQKKGGYGIGLSVAQSITEANHGQITAEYKDGNKICFSVFFHT